MNVRVLVSYGEPQLSTLWYPADGKSHFMCSGKPQIEEAHHTRIKQPLPFFDLHKVFSFPLQLWMLYVLYFTHLQNHNEITMMVETCHSHIKPCR